MMVVAPVRAGRPLRGSAVVTIAELFNIALLKVRQVSQQFFQWPVPPGNTLQRAAIAGVNRSRSGLAGTPPTTL